MCPNVQDPLEDLPVWVTVKVRYFIKCLLGLYANNSNIKNLLAYVGAWALLQIASPNANCVAIANFIFCLDTLLQTSCITCSM